MTRPSEFGTGKAGPALASSQVVLERYWLYIFREQSTCRGVAIGLASESKPIERNQNQSHLDSWLVLGSGIKDALI